MNDKKGGKTDERRLKLDVKHGFGSLGYTGIKEGIVFLEDEGLKLGFPIGKYFATKSVEKNEMNFLKLDEAMETLISVTVSKNRKTIALSEKLRGESVPLVSIYTLQGGQLKDKEKGPLLFRYTETKASSFVHMSFAYDDIRFLALLTGMAESQVILLDTNRMKPIATAILGQGATRVTISPKDNHVLFVSGDKVAKLLKVQEGAFKTLREITKLNVNQKFTDHCWTEDQKLLISNDQGEIFVVNQNYEVCQEIKNCFNLVNSDTLLAATTIKTFSKGFIIGAENGTIGIWTKIEEADQDDKDPKVFSFLRSRIPDFGRRSAVCSIDVSPNEEYAAFCFKNNDLALIPLNHLVPSIADVVDPGKLKKVLERDVKIDYLYNGFHNGPITCLDVCLHRPFIVTCSKADSSIRIWNYMNPKCELGSRFYVKEEGAEINPLLSVAFHPSGYYLAAGFVDKLRLYHVLSEDLRKYKEVNQKSCALLKFSNGGHLLAVASPKQKASNYSIIIYNAYTLELLQSLKANASTITEIMWTPNDDYLYTCGLDGIIYEWKTDDYTRKEYIVANAKFTSIMHATNGSVLSCGTEGGKNVVREIRGNELTKTYTLPNYRLSTMCPMTSLYKMGAVLGGTDIGQIKVYPGNFTSLSSDSFAAHNGEVTKIATSPDGRYVFTIGEDNTLFVYQVTEITESGGIVRIANLKDGIEDGKELNPRADTVDKDLADLILISRSDIDVYKGKIKDLQTQYYDLENKIEIKQSEDRSRLEREQHVAKDKMKNTVEAYEKSYEELKSQKIQLEKEYANLLKQMKSSHMKAVEELESLYEKKLAFENEKYLQLEQALIEEKNKNIMKLTGIERKHEDTIDKLQGEYKESFTRAHKIFETTKQTADNIKKEYEEKLNQQEQEHEEEIQDVNEKFQKIIEKLTNEKNEYKKKNDLFVIDNKDYSDKLTALSKQDTDRLNEINRLNTKLMEASNHIEMLKKDIEERDENLKKKEKKISEYKYKISDLQKSKHVLSFRTTEMRKSLEPKEAQIESLKEELFKLEGEFEGVLKASHAQNDKLVKTEKKIELLNNNLKKQTELSNKKEALLHSVIMDIHNCIKNQDPKEWGNEMKKLYQVYVINTEIKQQTNDPRSVDEMGRQIQHLEKSITQINKTTDNIVKRRDKDIYRKTIENSDLICDLNELRQKNKQLDVDLSNTRRENESLKKERKNLQDELAKKTRVQSAAPKRPLAGVRDSDTHLGLESMASMAQLTHFNNSYLEKKDIMVMPPIFQSKPERDPNLSAKGKLAKGSMFDIKNQAINDKVKLSELQAENDIFMQKLMQQDNEIKVLREKIEKAGLSEQGDPEEHKSRSDASPDESISKHSETQSQQEKRGAGSPKQLSPKFSQKEGKKNGLVIRSSVARMSREKPN